MVLEPRFTLAAAVEQVEGNDTVGNFSLTFAEEYRKSGRLHSGRKLLVLRAAVGGTGFTDSRWGLKDDLFLTMMEMAHTALSLHPENRLVALLWHQGETDALNNATFAQHLQNLTALVETVRTTYRCEALPFVAGDFVEQWKAENAEICKPVVDAIRAVCKTVGHARFVESTGLESNHQKTQNGDTIHFSREALYELGQRYYNAWRELCDIC